MGSSNGIKVRKNYLSTHSVMEQSCRGSSEQLSSEYPSEIISTPRNRIKNPKNSVVHDENTKKRLDMNNESTRRDINRKFHEAMSQYSSIIIQPSGLSLERSCKLDKPVFTLRDMPVKE